MMHARYPSPLRVIDNVDTSPTSKRIRSPTNPMALVSHRKGSKKTFLSEYSTSRYLPYLMKHTILQATIDRDPVRESLALAHHVIEMSSRRILQTFRSFSRIDTMLPAMLEGRSGSMTRMASNNLSY